MRFGLKLMLVLEAFFMFSGGLFGPIYAVFVEQIGGSILDVGFAAFAFLLSTGVLVYAISKWENRIKHQEKMYLLGYSLTALGYFAYTFVTNRIELFMVQVFLGIAQAIYIPVRDSLYTKFLQKGQETFQWGHWEAENFIVPAVAAMVGSIIVSTFNFRALFFIMSLIGLFGVAYGIKFFYLQK